MCFDNIRRLYNLKSYLTRYMNIAKNPIEDQSETFLYVSVKSRFYPDRHFFCAEISIADRPRRLDRKSRSPLLYMFIFFFHRKHIYCFISRCLEAELISAAKKPVKNAALSWLESPFPVSGPFLWNLYPFITPSHTRHYVRGSDKKNWFSFYKYVFLNKSSIKNFRS